MIVDSIYPIDIQIDRMDDDLYYVSFESTGEIFGGWPTWAEAKIKRDEARELCVPWKDAVKFSDTLTERFAKNS